MIYLDNNATTRLLPPVRDAILPWLDGEYGNPSSANEAGQRAKEALLKSRRQVAEVLGAGVAEVVFTSGATESNHSAILGALQYAVGRRRVVSSVVEHASTLKLLRWLESQGRIELVLVPVDGQGALDMDILHAAVTPDTALVTLMWANNETGVLLPVEQAAELAHAQGALFHTDAVQAVGKVALDWKESPFDLLSFSGHKLHAPKGVGTLLMRKGLNLPPLLFGSQERGRRGGTENLPGIVGLGEALAALDVPGAGRLAGLRDRFEQDVQAALPWVRVNGQARVCNTSNLCFPGLDGEALMMRLERDGVVVALGSACQSGGNAASHVLRAYGLSEAEARGSLRFSLSRLTTAAEMAQATERVIRTAAALRQGF